MLKTLLKKQFLELGKGFFYDAKKGRNRSKKGAIAFIVMYALLLFGFLGGTFAFLSYTMCPTMVGAGMGWIYFLILGSVAVILGIFGSVFSTYSSLYLSQDNDLLLSMPIPVKYILISRLAAVYIVGLVFSAIVMLPATIVYYICAPITSFWSIFCPFVFLVDISILVFVLSAALGWVVAKISTKVKNKSLITTAAALAGIGIYYYVYFKAINVLEAFLTNITSTNIEIKGAVKILYTIGSAGDANPMSLLIVTVISLAICALVFFILDKTFIKIVTTKTGAARIEYKEKKAKSRGVMKALVFRETKRFTSNTNYLLNSGLSIVITPIAAVFLLIKKDVVYEGMQYLFTRGTTFYAIIGCAAIMLLQSMIDITAPSVSLDAKNLWLLKSLPVKTQQILRAKVLNQLMFSLPTSLLIAICSAIALRLEILEIVLLLVFTLAYCVFSADFGLWANLMKPNLHWTSEIMVIKNSFAVFIAIFGGWIICALIIVSALFLTPVIGDMPVLLFWVLLTVLMTVVLEIWLRKGGSARYDNL